MTRLGSCGFFFLHEPLPMQYMKELTSTIYAPDVWVLSWCLSNFLTCVVFGEKCDACYFCSWSIITAFCRYFTHFTTKFSGSKFCACTKFMYIFPVIQCAQHSFSMYLRYKLAYFWLIKIVTNWELHKEWTISSWYHKTIKTNALIFAIYVCDKIYYNIMKICSYKILYAML